MEKKRLKHRFPFTSSDSPIKFLSGKGKPKLGKLGLVNGKLGEPGKSIEEGYSIGSYFIQV